MFDIRSCFVPRPNHVYIDADYNQLELFGLGQILIDLFGQSDLADVLNSGRDAHTALAATILGISYEAADKLKQANDHDFSETRRMAKQSNFGFGGGMGPDKFVIMVRKGYKMDFPIEKARELREAWYQQWPEMRRYFAMISEEINNPDGHTTIEIPRTHMLRGGCGFCDAANGRFQGLGAAAAKRAWFLLARACYVQPESPLYGSRTVNMVHDQFMIETLDRPEAHDAAMEAERLMVLGAKEFMPDCTPGVVTVLARYWSKSAKAEHDENGRLVPWPR